MHKQPPSKNIVLLFIDAIKDPMLLVLLVLAVVSIVLGVAFPEDESERVLGWIEGAAIICAVLIVSVVTAFNDWRYVHCVSIMRVCVCVHACMFVH